MSVDYKVVKSSTPGVKGGGDYKYYPRITNRQTVKMEELCKYIEKMSTFSEADVMGVLSSFIIHIPSLLKDNKSVDLEGLGIFSLHITAEGSDSEKDVTARKIKGSKIAFRPSTRLKNEISNTEYRKVKNRK